jgi:Peptidase M50B-like
MKYKVAEDARPQIGLLVTATVISIALWLIAEWFFSPARYLFYPLQLFATFIHEGSHVLASLITGSSVQSLTVSPDASGVVWSVPSGWVSQLFISSAGYLGATAFGVLLLLWIRFGYSSKRALYYCAGFIGVITAVFGFLMPAWNLFSGNATFFSVFFTVASGAVLTAGLFAVARFANQKWANFALSFLAAQCLLNAFFSLKDLFFVSTMTNGENDAMNMANATGIPAIVWILVWFALSVVMISIGLRVYAVSQKSKQSELPFVD